MVSSTCFEHSSVHHQKDLYMQFYGISPLDGWNYWFETHRGHPRQSFVSAVFCCQVMVSATKLITRPKESYRVWCLSVIRGPLGLLRHGESKKYLGFHVVHEVIVLFQPYLGLSTQKTSNIKCHPNPSRRSGVDEWKDDMEKRIGAFAALWNAPKI